jgi:hypothetical protein
MRRVIASQIGKKSYLATLWGMSSIVEKCSVPIIRCTLLNCPTINTDYGDSSSKAKFGRLFEAALAEAQAVDVVNRIGVSVPENIGASE